MRAASTALVLVLSGSALVAQSSRAVLDYPLAVGTRWTYHMHQENGAGVTFGEDLGKFAKGNTVDVTLVASVAGTEVVGGRTYSRIETRLDGKPFLFEWARIGPEGFVVGKTIDYQEGAAENLFQPEQRRISATLRPGDFWYWQARSAPLRVRYNVVGPGAVDVPAGRFNGTHLTTDGTLKAPFGEVAIRQDTWFVPHVGIARQETQQTVQTQRLTQIVVTLEKLEAAQAR